MNVSPEHSDQLDHTERPRVRRIAAAQPAATKVSWAAVIGGGILMVIFAAVAIQIHLIGRQGQLDTVESKIHDARVLQDRLREQEAELRSPAQITQTAANDLGMVRAAPPVLVIPPEPVIGYAQPQPAAVAAS